MNKLKKRLKQLLIIIEYIVALLIHKAFKRKYKDVWLISERGDEARDNGYEFYKYIKKNHKEIDVKYVITKESYDLSKINESDRVYYQSFKHQLIFLNAKNLISTHHMGYSPEFGMFGKLDDKGLVWCRGKRIFLQHGIIYNYLPSLVNKKIDLFITSSEKEKDFIINEFKYPKEIVKCTGLPRYDDLINENKNFILVMPTWRAYLYYYTIKEFKESEYYKNWTGFLQDERTKKLLEKYNVEILFYPHYEIQKIVKEDNFIENDTNKIKIAKSYEYEIHSLLKECKMFITDYSSTFFDIGYMNKPILYFQFDYDDFYLKHYKNGYMDLRSFGFGKSCSNIDELIKSLENILENNLKNEQMYQEREENFYKYRDRNNCERVYNHIKKLER